MSAKILSKPLSRLENSLTISNLWLSIFSLAKSGPVYAYNLPEQIEKKFNFKPSRLLVYLVLYRLEADGFLASKEEGQRKYYSLTKKGRECLLEGKKMLLQRSKEL